MVKIFVGISFIFFVYSCSSSKIGSSYAENVYICKNDSISLLTFTKLINFKTKNNFEFIHSIQGDNTISLSSGKIESNTNYIESGINLFFLNDSVYFNVDSFSKKAKVIKYGFLKEKDKGLQNITTSRKPINTFGHSFPKDTIINKNKIYYIDTIVTGDKSVGKVVLTLFFIKSDRFVSYHYTSNKPFPSDNFCFIGFSQKIENESESILMLIEEIKSLTKSEKRICNSILSKAKKHKKKNHPTVASLSSQTGR
jgi:hypothetical protein